MAVAGAGYGVWKHNEAKEHEVAADQANKRAAAHRAAAQAAKRHAQAMEATAAKEHHRANLAEDRTRKLAMEVANHAHRLIAGLSHEAAPPLHFDGCAAAATNGVEIRIDMKWLLSGIVDPAKEEGSIFGRIIGVVAHEWYHFLDTDRGTRPSHQEELSADKFAGKQLAKLGVPPNHFADLLRVFRQSKTHPDGQLRADTMLDAWTSETQKRAREAAEHITTIVMQPDTAEPVVQASRQRTRNGVVKTGAAKKGAARTAAAKASLSKKAPAKKGAAKASLSKKAPAKKGAVSAHRPNAVVASVRIGR